MIESTLKWVCDGIKVTLMVQLLEEKGKARLLVGGGLLLLLNTAYLAAFASPSLFYFANNSCRRM